VEGCVTPTRIEAPQDSQIIRWLFLSTHNCHLLQEQYFSNQRPKLTMNSLYSAILAVLLVTLSASADATKVEAKKWVNVKKWVVPEVTTSALRRGGQNGRRRMDSSSSSSSGKKSSSSSGKKSSSSSGKKSSSSSGKKSGKKSRTFPPALVEPPTPSPVDDGATVTPATPPPTPAPTVPPGDDGAIPATPPPTFAPATPPPTQADTTAADPTVCNRPSTEIYTYKFDEPCYDEAWGYTLTERLQGCFVDILPEWFGDGFCTPFNDASAEDSTICNDNISNVVCSENYCDGKFPIGTEGPYGENYNLSCKLSILNCCTTGLPTTGDIIEPVQR
jgi:hypothetical protein